MTDDALIQEGERLSKPCFLLTEEPQDSGIVGYWGGVPKKMPSFVTAFVTQTHRLTVDCRWFAKLGFGLNGTLSLLENERTEGGSVGQIDHKPLAEFAELPIEELPIGTPLYARPSRSFPPLAAVCLYGSNEVESWLKSKGLERYDYEQVENDAYHAVWQERCPLFANECAAMLGGWHIIWPEDDFYMPREMKLLIWTFKDSEPWIEVWMGRNFRVKYRIT
jgi:hypothetical protein